MGIEGAALATILSRAVAALLGLFIFFRTDYGPTVSLPDLRPDWPLQQKILRLGVPTALEQSMSAIALITLSLVVVQFSPPVVAAYGLGNRLLSLVFLPAFGVGRATNTMVGQNLGSGNTERAERVVWFATKLVIVAALPLAVITVLFAKTVVGMFIVTGTVQANETVDHTVRYLRIRSVEFAFMAAIQIFMGVYRGAGNTKTALMFALVSQ